MFEQTVQIEFEVLIVDNASTDGSAAAINAAYPAVRVLALEDNVGFAAANNLAVQHSFGEWLLLLNPDTIILDRAIERLVAFAKHRQADDPAAGVFGGRTLFPDGKLNPTSCWGRPTWWSTFSVAIGLSALFRRSRWANPEELRGWRRDTVRQVDIVTGCFFLLRRNLWHRLDGFDPAFFMYGEETDLCLRARRLGVKCFITPDATIVHYGGASETIRADKIVRLFKAKAQLFHRNWSPLAARWGVFTLDLWAWSRMLAFTFMSLARPKTAASQSTWRSIWRRRAEWHAPSVRPTGAAIVRTGVAAAELPVTQNRHV